MFNLTTKMLQTQNPLATPQQQNNNNNEQQQDVDNKIVKNFSIKSECTYSEMWDYLSSALNIIFNTKDRMSCFDYMDYYR